VKSIEHARQSTSRARRTDKKTNQACDYSCVRRIALPLMLLLWATGLCAKGPEVTLNIGTLQLAGGIKLQQLRLTCPALDFSEGIRCDGGQFSARLPAIGTVEGRVQARFESAHRWNAQISLVRKAQNLAELQMLAAALGKPIPGAMSGSADIQLDAELTPASTKLTAEIALASLTYAEPTGRYATDKLSTQLHVDWDSRSQTVVLTADSRSGQIYLEPLFLDFAVLPLHAQLHAHAVTGGWQIERLQATQGTAGTMEASGRISSDFKSHQLDMVLDATDLAPLLTADAQPFLIGTRLEGLTGTGVLHATLTLRDRQPTDLKLVLQDTNFDAVKLGLSFNGLSGEVNWKPDQAATSSLSWRAASAQKIEMGAARMAFRTQGHDFELLAPWQQPLLGGALQVERLLLRGIGSPQLTADFSGELKPIDLQALCKALGWPEFSGTLGGRLPGLSIRDNVWSVAGALEAQAFDGSVSLANLRAIEPFGVLPRVTADIHWRRLDLERVTRVFSFGRITGRIDGDVLGLRLLAWKPVAFDGRIYSSANDDTSRRISQRAINSISSIGGGPTGILSRGFLSLFQDFAYDRLGISCVLRDGRCQMNGIAATDSKDGQAGYYLVKGRLLPRIDVVGYSHTVSWNTLVDQIAAARASGGPQTQAPP
jgi:hypothetical protein